MLAFLKDELANERCGVSSRNVPSITGTKGNSHIPNVPHSLSTRCFGSLMIKQSITSCKLFRSCGQPTASASLIPRTIDSSREIIAQGAVAEPDCIIAWLKRCLKNETNESLFFCLVLFTYVFIYLYLSFSISFLFLLFFPQSDLVVPGQWRKKVHRNGHSSCTFSK